MRTSPKWSHCLSCFEVYAGAGLGVAAVQVKNSGSNSDRHTKSSWRGILKKGTVISLCENGYLDLFADYVYQSVSFHRRAEAGGFRLGGGLGLSF